jgi:hypothetical protein
MDDGDLHEQILRLEVHIEELAEATERCRKIIVMSKAAMGVGGILILAITVRAISSDPAAIIGAITSIICGIVVFGSNRSTRKQIEAAINPAEVSRAELINKIDLRVVGTRVDPPG